jgi:hypothetical protein
VPEPLRHLFWDYSFDHLRWADHRDLITFRVLDRGGWTDIETLLTLLSPADLRAFFFRTHGRGISARTLRYFEAALDLPHQTVTDWLADPNSRIWRAR